MKSKNMTAHTAAELVTMAKELYQGRYRNNLGEISAYGIELAQAVIDSLDGAEIVQWHKFDGDDRGTYPNGEFGKDLFMVRHKLSGAIVQRIWFEAIDWANFSHWADLPKGLTEK